MIPINDQNEIWNVSYQYSGSRVCKMESYFNSHPPTTVISEEFSYQNGYNVGDTLNNSLVWSLVKQDRWGHVTEEFDSLGTTTHSYDDYGNMLTMRVGLHSLRKFNLCGFFSEPHMCFIQQARFQSNPARSNV